MSNNWNKEKVSQNSSFLKNVYMEPNDVRVLKKFVSNEVQFYNECIDIFSAAFHRDSSMLKDLNVQQCEVFAHCASENIDIYKTKLSELPEPLQKYKEHIEKLSNDLKYLFSIKVNGNIAKSTKRRIAFSILKFFSDQAKIKHNNVIIDDGSDIQYKVSHQTLIPTTDFHKKHIQLDRKSCNLKYYEDTNETHIYTPYLRNPIIVKDYNMIQNTNWNYMIIRPLEVVTNSNTEWGIDLKKLNHYQYMYKFIDRRGKSSMFEIGKKNS